MHAAEAILAAGGAADCRLVQVGSPRCAVAEPLQARTAYLYAARRAGKPADPVCRLGTWGGWERTAAGWLRWNRLKYAPKVRTPLHIKGGHADYFREGEWYRAAADAPLNLQVTVDAMWATLTEPLPAARDETILSGMDV
ncbi:hypothetical protein ACFFK0_23910 [Paenibacillus chartarius]|uniref:Uncharacterized protein n=1 Tax=Paenibacillus chartarius TaxID=747481 RepID=A0ABV6DS11_9BACL